MITPIEFCYYLQGFNEIIGMPPTGERWEKIKELIKTVDMDFNDSTFPQSSFTAKNFIMWLSGFVELSGSDPTLTQWDIICDHLSLVFIKVTPNRATPTSKDDIKNLKDINKDIEDFMKKFPKGTPITVPTTPNPWFLPDPYIVPRIDAPYWVPPYTVTCSTTDKPTELPYALC